MDVWDVCERRGCLLRGSRFGPVSQGAAADARCALPGGGRREGTGCSGCALCVALLAPGAAAGDRMRAMRAHAHPHTLPLTRPPDLTHAPNSPSHPSSCHSPAPSSLARACCCRRQSIPLAAYPHQHPPPETVEADRVSPQNRRHRGSFGPCVARPCVRHPSAFPPGANTSPTAAHPATSPEIQLVWHGWCRLVADRWHRLSSSYRSYSLHAAHLGGRPWALPERTLRRPAGTAARSRCRAHRARAPRSPPAAGCAARRPR